MNKESKLFRNIAFVVLGVIILLLMVATIVEKMYGTTVAQDNIYTSPLMIALWAVLAITSLVYLVMRGVHRRVVVMMLHLSFVLILCGALITHIWGEQGKLHLRQGELPVSQFEPTDGGAKEFPFSVSLTDFSLEYYPGTFAPMDYISNIEITDTQGHKQQGRVSMNKIFSYQNYRFYQSGYDTDKKGTILLVAHDPYGIAVTYAGYLLLLLSMIAFFFVRATAWRSLLSHKLLRRAATAFALFILSTATLTAAPKVLSPEVAEEFGNLCVYYNDRVCPMQTLAKDFTVKLYGKSSYNGYTPEQVLTGWFFFYDDWKQEPMIKIKGSEVKELLGVEGKYARLSDFVSVEGYKLDVALQNQDARVNRANIDAANEKFNLVSMLVTGSLIKIYPYNSGSNDPVVWYSMTDNLPSDMPNDQWLFIRRSLSYVAEQVAINDDVAVVELLHKIAQYQEKVAGDAHPSKVRLQAEKLYNTTSYARPLAMVFLTIGFLSFFFCCRAMVQRKSLHRIVVVALNVIMIAAFIYLSVHIAMRGYISRHVPLSNGYETMMFMAWCSMLFALIVQGKFAMALPMGYILSGFTLLVAMMGEATPRITNLMPVLQSPLLSIHVVVIMISYSLLAFTMLNGLTAIVLRITAKETTDEVEYLQLISRILLYPAIFLLAIGIFIGAVWANVSWGRYWGWDPKEVWALITMLIYSLLLHTASLKWLQRPMVFHVFTVLAFLSVLITYFGVNFILGGMHSYA